MSRALFISGLLVLFISATLASNYKINPNTQFFIDQYNRSVLFHGLNAVYKLPPYYPPVLDGFDPELSLSDIDFQNLRSWGLNMIRLYMSWEGTEKVRGQYNATYMEIVKGIVQTAAKYNISVLLDAHQDIGSRKFCGEGLPDWAVNRTDFPKPLTYKISYDDQGYANLDDCSKAKFAEFYVSSDVRNTFKSLYTNVDGIADNLAAFWKNIAAFFKDEPNIIGYELINEPPTFDLLDNTDKEFLQPFYQKIHEQIRQADDETIIFFEPDVFDIFSVGFTQGPGGPSYNDRQALSYHVYCPFVNDQGEPSSDFVCKTFDNQYTGVKTKAIKNLGLAGFLTEFGALAGSDKGAAEINNIATLADASLHSWTYWQFKWFGDFTTAAKPGTTESVYNQDGSLQDVKVKALARSYAHATCGVPTSQTFDPSTGKFTFSYKASNLCNGQNTELYLSKTYYYKNGFKQTFQGCDGCTLSQIAGTDSYYAIQVPAGVKEGTVITIQVTPQ